MIYIYTYDVYSPMCFLTHKYLCVKNYSATIITLRQMHLFIWRKMNLFIWQHQHLTSDAVRYYNKGYLTSGARMTVRWLSDDCQMLSDAIMKSIWRLDECQMTVRRNVRWLSDAPSDVRWLSDAIFHLTSDGFSIWRSSS